MRQADSIRQSKAKWARRQSEAVADIGEIPAVVNPERRESCRLNLQKFLVDYFPASTGLKPFSASHRRMINRIERCILNGGLFANAFPRGFAKTTIGENATIWACVYGHRKFVPVFAADAPAAERIIESIKLELSENELLYEDFPEVCHAIKALEGKPQRCLSQTFTGLWGCAKCNRDACEVGPFCQACAGGGFEQAARQTHIGWRSGEIIFPTIPGSIASGAIITARGITGAARGMKHKRPDGTQQRPDFVILDDPQTDESASTPAQVDKRLNIIAKSILKLSGHDRKIACVMNATVIRPGDMIEQILDPKKHPAWQGERVKMVRKWSDVHDSLWMTDYARLRNTYDADVLGDQQRAHTAATEFYELNREKMDAGCEITWEHCFDEATEISAIQHAYNALIDDGEEVFASEYQNEPLEEKVDDDDLRLTADFIASKVNQIHRGDIPVTASRIVAFIDPKKDLLYYTVCAFGEGFSGWICDYGTFPDQRRGYFNSRKPRFGLQKKGEAWESCLYAALDALTAQIATREWKRDDGAVLKCERVLIDHGWGDATETIDLFCRQSTHATLLTPTKGIYVGAKSQRGFNDLPPKPGERRGPGWRQMPAMGKHAVRPIRFDANHWKTFVANRWKTPMGGRGCLSLFGDKPELHKLFADHQVSERPIAVSANGRRIVEWQDPPPGIDNDYLDCIVGCHVAAAERGLTLHEQKPRQAKKSVRFADAVKTRRVWSANAR